MPDLEIERKFLLYPIKVECFLKINGFDYEKQKIEQFYIKRDGKIGRIRKINDKYYLTLKKGEGMVREESEAEIDRSVFRNILSKEKPVGALKKIRFKIKIEGYEYEIDEFLGDLDGLVMLEVEFNSEVEAKDFEPHRAFKRFIVGEVTDKLDFFNESIAKGNLRMSKSCDSLYSLISKK